MSWFSFKKNQSKKISTRKRFERGFEMLEKRQVLAGQVEVNFTGGNIELKGDAGDNDIEIYRDGAGYWLLGNGTSFLNKTPPNMDPFPVIAADVPYFLGNANTIAKITADLGDGSDKLFIHGTAPSRVFNFGDAVDIKMGAGSDDVFTLDFVSAFNRFSYDGEGGTDTLTVTRADFHDNVTLVGGDGSDTITMIGELPTLFTSTRPITVDGILNVDLGAGSDTFTAQVFVFENNFNLTAGDGADNVFIGGLTEAPFDADMDDFSTASAVNGGLNIDLGAGLDNLTLTFMSVEGNTSITGGAESDTINITGSTDIELDDDPVDTSVPIHFQGSLTVDLGAGTNSLLIMYGTFASSITVTGGTTTDNVTILGKVDLVNFVNNVQLTVAGSINIDLGDGTNKTTMNYVAVGAGISIKGGNGSDTVLLTGEVSLATPLTTAGSINIDLGDSTNKTTITYADIGVGISIKGGNGSDTVLLSGDVSLATPLTTFSTLSIDLGDGGNSTTLTYVEIGTALTYKGGNDGDNVTIRGNVPAALRSRFIGDASIDVGNGSNTVNITYTDFVRALAITGGTGTDNVIISGETTDASALVIGGNLNVNLGNGGNTMTLTFVDVGASLIYRGGDDGDTVTIRGDVPSQLRSRFGGDATIDVGNGSNTVNITYSDFEKALAIIGGTGTDTVTISGEVTDNSPFPITGNLNVSLGDGSNSLTLIYFAAAGNITYTGGSGIDTLRLLGLIRIPPGFPHGSSIGGNLTVSTLESNDTVEVAFVNIDGNVTITTGDGIDNVRIHGINDTAFDLDAIDSGAPVTIDGNLSVDAGAGNDTILVEFGAIGGSATLTGGDGNDTITVSGKDDTETDDAIDGSARITIGGSLTVNLGDGTNTFNMDDAQVGLNFVVNGGSGVDTVNVTGRLGSAIPQRTGRQLLIGGSTSVSLSGGNDSFTMSGFLADGNFTLDSGDGNDGVILRGLGDTPNDIDAVDSGIASIISGTLTVVLGNGNDSLLIDFISTIGASLQIDAGAGNDSVRILGNEDIEKDDGGISITATQIAQNVVILLGEGNNSLLFEYFIVGRAVTVTSGSGADSIVLHPFPDQSPNNGINDAIPSLISQAGTGDLTILSGAGADFVDVLNVTLGSGGVTIVTEQGADNISIGLLTATGAISIDTGTEADNVQIDGLLSGNSGITITLGDGADRLIANTLSASANIAISSGAGSDELEIGGDSSAGGTVTIDLGTATPRSGLDSVKTDGISANGEITVIKGLGGQSDMYLDFMTTNSGITVLGNDETDQIRLFHSSARTHFNITSFDPNAGSARNGIDTDLVFISLSDVSNGGIAVSTGFDDDHVEIGLWVNIMQLLAPGFTFFFDGDLDGDGVFDGGAVTTRDDIVVDTGFQNASTAFSGADYVFVGWTTSRLGNLVVNTGDLSDKIEIYNLFVQSAILNTSDPDTLIDINDALLGGANDTAQIGYLTTFQTFNIVTGSGNDLVSFYASHLVGVGNVNAGEDHDTVATVVQQYDSDFFIQMLTGYNTLICDNVISKANFYYAATAGTGNATVKNSQALRMNLTLGNDYDVAVVTGNAFTRALYVTMGSGDDWLTVTGNYLPYEMTLDGGAGRFDRLTLVGSSGRPTNPTSFEVFY